MKWFRITSPGWQVAIVFALVIFLWWDSMLVPGPDGRVVVELYELPFSPGEGRYKTIGLFEAPNIQLLDEAVPIVKLTRKEPIVMLGWLTSNFPSFQGILPQKYRERYRPVWFPEVSLTLEQWKKVSAYRQKDSGPLWFRPYE